MAVIFKTSALASAPTTTVQGGERKTRRKTRPRAERSRTLSDRSKSIVNSGQQDVNMARRRDGDSLKFLGRVS